jgi:hypothetical protein
MRYLILTYVKRPNDQIDEQMEVSRRVRTRDVQMANVILDFKELKVVKCSMGGVNVPPEWDRILGYYYQHYQSTIDRLLRENGYEIVKPESTTEPEKANEEPNNSN